jgi:F-type H+-transporting ATPase subunit c
MSTLNTSLELVKIIADLQVSTMVTVTVLITVGAIATAIGFAFLGSKFMESIARQPEIASQLQTKLFIIAGLLDAIAMIGTGLALFIIFNNPFMAAVVTYLPK